MTDRPIIFSAAMVRALLDGRKSMTHQVLKPQPPEAARYSGVHFAHDEPPSWFFNSPSGPCKVREVFASGDRLWVREAWGHDAPDLDTCRRGVESDGISYGPYYMADANWFDNQTIRKRSPIHMPRWASRLTLTVTDARVQRLAELTEDDARAEGVDPLFSPAEARSRPEFNRDPMPWLNYLWHGHEGQITRRQINAWPYQFSSYRDARGSFSSLWERIHGPGSWEANPRVVALTFTVRRGNIDAPAEWEAR